LTYVQLLDEYFGKDEELDKAGAFLKAYLANKVSHDKQVTQRHVRWPLSQASQGEH
jgi:hypothetical protein